MRHPLLAIALAALGAAAAADQSGSSSGGAPTVAGSTAVTAATDAETFVRQAAIGGLYEVRASQLAIERGLPTTYADLATTMVRDHSRANRELESLAKGKGMVLPAGLDQGKQAMIDRLLASGDRFEREYLDQLLRAHREDVALFRRAAQQLEDAELRQWAQQTLPVLEQHLAHVEGLAAR